MTDTAHLEIAKHYLRAIEEGATGDVLADFFDSTVVQQEFPNRFLAHGARRNLAEILDAAERGQKVLSRQSFEVVAAIAQGDRVALEVQWMGVLAITLGTLPVGGEMRAHFAVFLNFRDGKIVSQRNYDCFEPW